MQALFEAKKRLGNVRPYLFYIGGKMKEHVTRGMDRGINPITEAPHKPLSEFSKSLKKARGYSDTPLLGTGALQRSVTNSPISVEGNKVSIASKTAYSSLQQEGGTIKPKRSKYLAIPLCADAMKAGNAKTWCSLNAKKFFFFTSRKGNLFIAQNRKSKGGKSTIDLKYLLVLESIIPARPFMGFTRAAKQEIITTFTKWIDKGPLS